MKNASNLIYALGALFSFGFLYESAKVMISGAPAGDMPAGMYMAAYAFGFLLPALICVIVASVLRRAWKKNDTKKL